jgi:hypothetical protein
VFFDVASSSFLRAVVPRARLVDANARFATSAAAAQVAGPGLAGALLQVVSAPVAVVLDAASFLASAACIALMRAPEAAPASEPGGPRPGLLREAADGLRFVLATPLLRANVVADGAFNFFTSVFWAVYLLYATRELEAPPAVIGAAFALSGAGGLVGAAVAARTARRFGIGPTVLAAALVNGLGWWPVGFGGGPPAVVAALLGGSHLLRGLAQALYGVNLLSLRQAAVPDHLQGRVAATARLIGWGTLPIGSLVGGLLGGWLGLQATAIVGAVGGLAGFAVVALSPIPALRRGAAVALGDEPAERDEPP